MKKYSILYTILLLWVSLAYAQISPAPQGHVIEDEGTKLPQQPYLNFVGSTLTCTNDAANRRTVCTSTATAAPTDAQYWTGAADSTLSAEKNLGALSTGLVLNTAGTPTAYAGTSCTNQFPRSLSASGAATCATVSLTADVTGTLPAAKGGTDLTAATDDNVMVGNGTVWQSKAVPDCDDTVGQHLNYDTTTNAFSCGTSKPVDYRTCTLVIGTDNGSALADADLGPQGRQCLISVAATLVEITVAADGGTPNVIPRRNRAGTGANFVSAALATAAAGGLACSKTGAVTGLDGATTCSATLQNTGLNAGDWIELISGTAGGTAKRMSISLTYSIP